MLIKLVAIVLILGAVQFIEVKALKCYSCMSSKEWGSCDDVRKEVTCAAGMNSCLKLEGTMEGEGVEEKQFLKMCTNVCDETHKECKKPHYKDGAKITCKVNCCTGDLCNAGSIPLVSAIIMMLCALAAALSYIL